MSVVDSRDGASRDVGVLARPGRTALDLHRALAESGVTAAPGPHLALMADGRELDPSHPVGMDPLVHGVTLWAQPSGMPPEPDRAIARLDVVNGVGAGRSVPLHPGVVTIGRDRDADVTLTDPSTSRSHVRLRVAPDGLTVADLDSTNGSELVDVPSAGTTVTPVPAGAEAPIGLDEGLRLGGTLLCARRRRDDPVRVSSPGDGCILVNRPPRPAAPPPPPTFRLPDPPEDPAPVRLHLLASLAPAVLSVLLAIVMRSPLMLLFGLLTPVAMIATFWSDRRHGRRSHREDVRRHADELASLGERMRSTLAEERVRLLDQHPDPAQVLDHVGRRQRRVWERRAGDPDRLVARLGSGTIDSACRIESHDATPRKDTIEGLPELRLGHSPVTVDLAGVLGVAGPRPATRASVATILGQVCAWHAPRECAVHVLTARAEHDWGWLTWTPHLHAVVGPDEAEALARALTTDSAGGLVDTSEDARTSRGPRHLVVLDGVRELLRHESVGRLLDPALRGSIAVICLAESTAALPTECTSTLEICERLDTGAPGARLQSDDRCTEFTPDLPDDSWCMRLGRALAPLRDITPVEGAARVPRSVDLLDLLASEEHPRAPTW